MRTAIASTVGFDGIRFVILPVGQLCRIRLSCRKRYHTLFHFATEFFKSNRNWNFHLFSTQEIRFLSIFAPNLLRICDDPDEELPRKFYQIFTGNHQTEFSIAAQADNARNSIKTPNIFGMEFLIREKSAFEGTVWSNDKARNDR